MHSSTSVDQDQDSADNGEQRRPRVAGTLTRLPELLTSFIGREREIEDLGTLLRQPFTRLITLTGPGGVGKTRLAVEVARALDLEIEVAFIPLASVSDPALVAPTIGAVLGFSDTGGQSLAERLAAVLEDSPLLLVLDNFEHIVDAAPITATLLSNCPSLKILATSRRPLRVSAEIKYRVPPLTTPGPGAAREHIEQSESFRLFVERAPDGGMSKSAGETAAISQICSRLDGLPLAIELAAARTRVLTPAELLSRLNRRLALLTDGPVDAPARLRTMRDAIAWSYDLLSNDEQQLLRTLSVFSGGFTVDAVEAVAPAGLEFRTLDLLTQLIDHSLVRRMETQAGTARFTLLETIREFALDALQARDEEANARNRHLAWMIEFVGSPTPERFDEMRGPADAALYDELNNLRLALSWAIDQQDAPRAAQIAWGLLRIWWHYGLTSDGLESVQRIADQPAGLDPRVHATVMGWVASLSHEHGQDERARVAASQSLAMFRDIGYAPGINFQLWDLAQATMWTDPAAASELFGEAVELGREIGDRRMLACDLLGRSQAYITLGEPDAALTDLAEAIPLYEWYHGHDETRYEHALALNFTAWAHGMRGDFQKATEFITEGFAFSQQFAIGVGIFSGNRVLGELARRHGDLQLASTHLVECLHTARRESWSTWQIFVILQIAMLAQAAGDWYRAARLFGYADKYWTQLHFSESTRSMATWGYTTEPTRLALGTDDFAGQFEAGQRLTSFEALTEASSVSITDHWKDGRRSSLTPRETEVLVHLAQGKTNQEIAADLFVGKSTIDTHVAHILAKLNVDSRRAAVEAARERGLLPASGSAH